ncbi:UNVERIFIED_CONTAM: hypothetical protein Slati_0310800 [Sesamum latifolium]|uniref:Uncharacterized protein n=1 Tax=Sesamum latifolium TaxID=2727402 RepID=A0AAW2YEL1_9LAMI
MSSTAMSIPLPFTTVNSTIINHRPFPPLVRPSARFLPMSLFLKSHLLPLCSANCSHTDSPESSDFGSSYVEKEGSNGKDGKFRALSSNEILTRLKRYGIAGILSYGLLNTAYYLTTFLVVWALALAPFVDRGLSWFTAEFGFESQGKCHITIFTGVYGYCWAVFWIGILDVCHSDLTFSIKPFPSLPFHGWFLRDATPKHSFAQWHLSDILLNGVHLQNAAYNFPHGMQQMSMRIDRLTALFSSTLGVINCSCIANPRMLSSFLEE